MLGLPWFYRKAIDCIFPAKACRAIALAAAGPQGK
jgi:hypothetical protein